jgi:cell division protease FtsH
VLGRRERSNILLAAEKRAVAAHEAGHALVAALLPGTDPVAKVTIIPSGPSLGATQQLPLDDRHLYSESFLRATLAVMLGGRAGEIIAIGEASSGAADDLAKATELATRMVRELGMSAAIGPVGYAGTHDYLGPNGTALHEFSDATQRTIDTEVANIVRAAQTTAVDLLSAHRAQLDELMGLLVEEETIDGRKVYDLVGTEPKRPTQAPVTIAPAPASDNGLRVVDAS